MMKRKFLPRAVLGAILLALPAAADAPRNPPQYAQFLADSPTIVDNFTVLEWERRIPRAGNAASFANGGLRCKGIFTVLFPPPSPAGADGRLPSVKELLTILDEEPHNEYEFGAVVPKMIDQLAFSDTPVDLPYWSSSPAGGGLFWTLDFKTGAMVPMAPAALAHVRCVR